MKKINNTIDKIEEHLDGCTSRGDVKEHSEIRILIDKLRKQLLIPRVVKSLPSEKKMDLGEWMKYEGIKEDGFGGLDWKGTQYTAYEIEKMHKEYLK